jgi:thiol-disulfide isomerase/thioredoxin
MSLNPMIDPSPPEPLEPIAATQAIRRRRWLLSTCAIAAGAGGAGLAWWNSRLGPDVPPAETIAAQTLPAPPTPKDGFLDSLKFWDLTFDSPTGQPVALSSLQGRLLLINFWATWCPPCIEELPLINAFYQQNSKKGWQVLGLAVDNLTPVKNFLIKTPVNFPVALSGMEGIALSKSLGNMSGGLPFTVVIGSQGSVLHRKIGKISIDDLRAWESLT